MARGKPPQEELNAIQPTKVQALVRSLRELHSMGQPKSNQELAARIEAFFAFCERTSLRPGIETMCVALHISRTTLFNWSNGIGCDDERRRIIESAKSFVGAFLEQASLTGHLNPATSCFLFKNWLSYKDTVSIEEALPAKQQRRVLPADAKLTLLDADAERASSESLPSLCETSGGDAPLP